ncbi:MAG: hypothetical protein R3B40_04175 [Polyangiales bacterium]|nr:hypothetical protein [Myxococcales bacterium]MCB9660154.1 hypothetical protein [Sandaracinaceae bacterium]
MTIPGDVGAVLALGELAVAAELLNVELRTLKKRAKSDPTALTPLLRQRAILAEESAIDDDLPSLVREAKVMGEAAAQPDATDDDRARWAFGLLMANMTGKARKAHGSDPQVKAGLAYAAKPGPVQRAALFAASQAHPERAVRLVLQRSEPVVDEARALFEARRAEAPLPARHTLRALRLLVGALRTQGDPEAETLNQLDPEYGLAAADALRHRRERLKQVEGLLGADSPLLLQPTFALAAAAKRAGELALSVTLHLEVDDRLAKRRTADALVERSALLVGVFRDLVQLERHEDAEAVIARIEHVAAKRGLDVPEHNLRAELHEARGDYDGALVERRLAVAQARDSTHPAYGPGSPNLELAQSWLKQAEARFAKARAR